MGKHLKFSETERVGVEALGDQSSRFFFFSSKQTLLVLKQHHLNNRGAPNAPNCRLDAAIRRASAKLAFAFYGQILTVLFLIMLLRSQRKQT